MTDTMRLRARVGAPIKDVRHALTDADAMRTWLAEHAEADLPDRYEFWGRYTPDGDAPHQRPLHVDDHTLRFSWLLGGEDTTVEITLSEEDATSTILSLSQTHFPPWDEAVAETSVLAMTHTFWSLAIANLIDHVEGREPTPMCDFTSPVQRAHVVIDAPPDAVFDSLVRPEVFRRWFGANVDIEPFVGGRFAMGSFELDEDPAKIVELEPGRKMTMAWGSMVGGWELEGSAGRTRLTFMQSGFDERQPPYGSWMGWLSAIAELRRYHELTDWRSVWLEVDMPGIPEGLLVTD